ncbi:hypothetical protein FG93_02921 [Bosea sp. LC85]|uniref:hypothetical protein n=1 Tax=Bosea sp. LC85 TaxID=1502851 RepID=UPI0004E3E4EE|nr:hypothetical protein [Bosea sp. LC85]KFC70469.1 hypothetical protein FG93_02921 [Bosea sp. LC85]
MEDIFEAVRVTSQQAQAAYALMAMANPGLSISDWATYLRRYEKETGQERGLIALYDRRRCIHGIFAYEVAQPLSREATLNVSELASVRLPGTVLIDALMRFANTLAGDLNLPAIALELEPSAVWAQDQVAMEQRGFALERVRMRGRTW